ncbi:hypothetical protein [Methylorubrum extorquens]|uniref:SpoVT-AbrB domain-containing protein n=1 Tax=Methylorubrum extorquens TaxID=408 RepID=A0AAX3WBS9_METEX|nr:hypothetical protein [Methylorubrum extorquens]WHQ68633.1 hypothetical protein KEC54_20020 [Methylorubrum extorquens]
MSHVSVDYAARASDHAVRRYAERVLGLPIPPGLDDQRALSHVRARGTDCAAIRQHLAGLGGVILAAGMRSGTVVVPLERMRLRVSEGTVVTVLTPEPKTLGRALRQAA